MFYSLNVSGRHEGAKSVEVVVHLASAVTFNSNVGHALALYFFFVFDWFCSFSLSFFSGDGRGFGELGLFSSDLLLWWVSNIYY